MEPQSMVSQYRIHFAVPQQQCYYLRCGEYQKNEEPCTVKLVISLNNIVLRASFRGGRLCYYFLVLFLLYFFSSVFYVKNTIKATQALYTTGTPPTPHVQPGSKTLLDNFFFCSYV